jgi:coenzyme Q-binding protein COQ10
MKFILTFFISFFIMTTIAMADDELAILKSGKPIVREDTSSSKGETELIFLVKSSPEKIWDVLVDYEKYPEFMPIEKIKIRSHTKDVDIVYIQPEAPPLVDISYELKRNYNKDSWKITFERVSGKIKSINGWWKLEPYDSHYTKVMYVTHVDIGIPVPKFVTDYFAKGSLYKMAEAVKKRVETNGRWRKK